MIINKHRILKVTVLTYLLLAVGMSFSYAQKKNKKASAQAAQLKSGAAVDYFMDGVRYALTDDNAKAVSAFEQSLRLDPKNAAAHYKLAEILLQQNQYDQAVDHARQALALDKSNEWYYMILAESQLRSGNASEAAATVETMLSKTKAPPHNYLKLAQLYLQQNQVNKALTALDNAEKALGVDEEVVALKQRLYLNQNKPEEALAEGEKLVSNFPHQNIYALRQAQLLINLDRKAEAQKYLESYLKKNPEDPEALFLMAKTYEQQEQHNKAGDELLKAFSSPGMAIEPKLQEAAQLISQLPNVELEASLLQLTNAIKEAHPEDSRAYAISGDYLLAVNRKNEARGQYLKALEFDESNFEVWQNALTLGMELGRFDSVAKEADEALMLFPNQAALYYFSGAANLSLNQYDEAVMALEQGKKLAASNKQLSSIFNSHLGDAYNGLKRYDLSDAAYEAALAINPNNPYILNNYSYYLALRNDKLQQALEMSKKLVELEPENPNYLDTHAWVYYQLKEYDKARNILEKALKHADDADGTILEHYGDVLFQLNRKEEAVQQWKKAKDKNSTSELIDKKIQDQKLYE
ncbi:tetratricopeptide repeat protein [Cesiribacter sp. SM1]|uniref:tetratricopeptide repeat protein n=1 Tax=Cesiribacter sp. SM1 TaxID=2861196 RepID=UPI001CD64146|nr:tetratricopeptide repeat protein [Cesiribacter sp. SM1]